ncbi:DUF1983 domain-containing protein (plasmid) [Klebsiella pneumoniae subsp. pneumoniae]|uniref:DUF1983 domain-containing protein n=1 Tax=Klebsiella pneumoniae subsp. pneumoniae TaxID=72407 RepID=A0A7S9HF57_KLEPN|nr:DUF1983 domain-containing protein [Klebsiella pneumoniae subsp. pneumoniae]
MQSQFLVQADRFGLINTSNGNTTTPFVVENGVAYMNAAVIKDGSITNAKLAVKSDLTISLTVQMAGEWKRR